MYQRLVGLHFGEEMFKMWNCTIENDFFVLETTFKNVETIVSDVGVSNKKNGKIITMRKLYLMVETISNRPWKKWKEKNQTSYESEL